MLMDDEPMNSDLDFDQYGSNRSGIGSGLSGFNNSIDEGADLFTMRLNRALESQV